MLTGLRGVGKTVLLNTLRSQAINHLWGTGKIEARPDQSLRRPVAAALHMAVRELAPRHRAPDRIDDFLGVLKAFAQRSAPTGRAAQRRSCATAGSPASTCRPQRPGRLRRHRDRPGRAAHRRGGGRHRRRHRHRALHRRDAGPRPGGRLGALRRLPRAVPARGAADRGRRRAAAPAGRAVGAAKSYSERLFRYQRIDRLDRIAADQALCAPAEREEVEYEQKALDLLYEKSGGYPYFVQAYGKATWDHAPALADHRRRRPGRRAGGRGRAGRRLLRLPLRAGHPGRAGVHAGDGALSRSTGRSGSDDMDAAVPTAEIARVARPQAGQPVPGPGRADQEGADLLRRAGTVAFTVPHFGRYLRTQPA